MSRGWTTSPHSEQALAPESEDLVYLRGMALEARTVTVEEPDNPELRDMTRRFWVSLVLTLPVVNNVRKSSAATLGPNASRRSGADHS